MRRISSMLSGISMALAILLGYPLAQAPAAGHGGGGGGGHSGGGGSFGGAGGPRGGGGNFRGGGGMSGGSFRGGGMTRGYYEPSFGGRGSERMLRSNREWSRSFDGRREFDHRFSRDFENHRFHRDFDREFFFGFGFGYPWWGYGWGYPWWGYGWGYPGWGGYGWGGGYAGYGSADPYPLDFYGSSPGYRVSSGSWYPGLGSLSPGFDPAAADVPPDPALAPPAGEQIPEDFQPSYTEWQFDPKEHHYTAQYSYSPWDYNILAYTPALGPYGYFYSPRLQRYLGIWNYQTKTYQPWNPRTNTWAAAVPPPFPVTPPELPKSEGAKGAAAPTKPAAGSTPKSPDKPAPAKSRPSSPSNA